MSSPCISRPTSCFCCISILTPYYSAPLAPAPLAPASPAPPSASSAASLARPGCTFSQVELGYYLNVFAGLMILGLAPSC